MLVCHELETQWCIGFVSESLLDSDGAGRLEFWDLLGDAYHEISDHVFAKA